MSAGGPCRGAVRAGACLALAALLAACWVEEVRDGVGPDAPATAAVQIEEALLASAEAWNAGDLDGFMALYERSPASTYIGSAGLVEGYDAIRARYAPLFWPGAERDSLRFEDVRARLLGNRFALATARWILHRGDSVTAHGPFTLVLQRVEVRWRIIHDHSSETPPGVEPGSGTGGGAAPSDGAS